MHTEKFFFRYLIRSTRIQIVFTIFRLIWIQTDVHLDPNQWQIQTENGKYNLISVWFNKISEKILCVYAFLARVASVVGE